jgi:tetratricopeptide (TPR) repeat protein
MTNLDYIDNYFKGDLPEEEIPGFEQKIVADHGFAEEVAFYCSAMQVAGEEAVKEKKDRFRTIYLQNKPGRQAKLIGLKRWWPYIAAASVLFMAFIGWQVWFKPSALQTLANTYINTNLKEINVQMSTTEDSMSTAIRLFNENKLSESLARFDQLAQSATAPVEDARKDAGITALRLGDYDKALAYFTALENMKLYSNSGKFYHALTLMKRNHPGDKEAARQLLNEVVRLNLEKKDKAEEWLRDF